MTSSPLRMNTHLQYSYMYYLAAIITVKELEFLNAHQYVSAKIHHGLAKVFRRGMSVSSVSSYPILNMYSLDGSISNDCSLCIQKCICVHEQPATLRLSSSTCDVVRTKQV